MPVNSTKIVNYTTKRKINGVNQIKKKYSPIKFKIIANQDLAWIIISMKIGRDLLGSRKNQITLTAVPPPNLATIHVVGIVFEPATFTQPPPHTFNRTIMNGGVSLSRAANACDPCRQAHAACDSARPCGRCVATGRGHLCEQTTMRRKRGRPPKQQPTDQLSFSLNTHLRTTPPTSAPYQQEHECTAMEAKRARGSPGKKHNFSSPPWCFRCSFLNGLCCSIEEPAKNDMTSTAAPTSVVGASSRFFCTSLHTGNLFPHLNNNNKHSGTMVDSVVSLLIDEIKELKLVVRQQKEENDRLCTRLSKLEEKVTLQNRKIDSLLRDSPASSPSSGATPPQVPGERRRGGIPLIVSSFLPLPMPVHVRQVRHQILKFLPFLADYGIANPAVPFVLDDLRKPFAVLLSKPKEDSCSKNSPVYLFANQAYCEQLGYSLVSTSNTLREGTKICAS